MSKWYIFSYIFLFIFHIYQLYVFQTIIDGTIKVIEQQIAYRDGDRKRLSFNNQTVFLVLKRPYPIL